MGPQPKVIFLSSSQGEGWSGVLREAMACNIPVIAVRQPAKEEQVRSGLLIGEDPAEWEQALHRLFQDEPLRRELARNARENVRKYTMEAMVEKTEACYKSLLG